MLGFIFSLIVFVVILGIVIACLQYLTAKIPYFRGILAIIIGLLSFAHWQMWWLSGIISILSYGLFVHLTKNQTPWGGTIHCENCGCDVLDITSQSENTCTTKCKRYGHVVGWIKG